jgi:hypothetical protein
MTSILNNLSGRLDDLNNWVVDQFNSIKNTITNSINSVTNWAAARYDAAKAWVDNAATNISNLKLLLIGLISLLQLLGNGGKTHIKALPRGLTASLKVSLIR